MWVKPFKKYASDFLRFVPLNYKGYNLYKGYIIETPQKIHKRSSLENDLMRKFKKAV